MQRIVNNLHSAGIVAIEPNPHYLRSQRVVLTARGRAAYDAALRLWSPLVEKLAAGLSASEVAVARTVMMALRQKPESLPATNPTNSGDAQGRLQEVGMSARLIFNVLAGSGPARCQQRKSRGWTSAQLYHATGEQAHTIRFRRLVEIHWEAGDLAGRDLGRRAPKPGASFDHARQQSGVRPSLPKSWSYLRCRMPAASQF